jgi:hypothetical protein
VNGVAKGFLKRAWNTIPESDNPAPARNAAMALGNLKFQKTELSAPSVTKISRGWIKEIPKKGLMAKIITLTIIKMRSLDMELIITPPK